MEKTREGRGTSVGKHWGRTMSSRSAALEAGRRKLEEFRKLKQTGGKTDAGKPSKQDDILANRSGQVTRVMAKW